MDEHGKKSEVLIEPEIYIDSRTGMPLPITSLTVWADEGLKDVIANVPGVRSVIVHLDNPTQYYVYIDHRYDTDFVGREIEAAIICR